jgi:hypothetical protein
MTRTAKRPRHHARFITARIPRSISRRRWLLHNSEPHRQKNREDQHREDRPQRDFGASTNSRATRALKPQNRGVAERSSQPLTRSDGTGEFRRHDRTLIRLKPTLTPPANAVPRRIWHSGDGHSVSISYRKSYERCFLLQAPCFKAIGRNRLLPRAESSNALTQVQRACPRAKRVRLFAICCSSAAVSGTLVRKISHPCRMPPPGGLRSDP